MIANLTNSRLFRKLKERKHEVAILGSVLILFLATFGIVNSINPVVEDVPDYNKLTENPYKKYEKTIKKEDLEKLISDEQFIGLKYIDKLIEERSFSSKDDPFAENPPALVP